MNTEARPADDHQPAAERRRGPMRFAYPSGSTPLAGYTIKRGIGAGGFGDVYYATSDAGKDVALKRIQRNLDVELRGVSQCLNLKHPNLVALYDIRYDDEQQAWVVMEYVAGDSLQDVIERHPDGMPSDLVHHWFRGISDGVAYLHEHGIVHRDLKPGNIFLDGDLVKIGDYGLSKFISCSRRSGQTESVGTFHYMAPEIGLGRYGKEIDIYALGILFYEMLTGRVPYEGESSQEIIMKHLTADPDLSQVPANYRPVIAKALAKDPNQRFSNVRDFINAVYGNASESETVQTETVSRPAAAAAAAAMGAAAAPRPRDAAQEPLAAFVRQQLHSAQSGWHNLTSSQQVVVAVFGVLLVLGNLPWLAPTAMLVALTYCCYYAFWALFVKPAGPSRPPQPPGIRETVAFQPVRAEVVSPASPDPSAADTPPPVPPQGKPKCFTRRQINDRIREALRKKTWTQAASELTGSMIVATISSLIVSFVLVVASGASEPGWSSAAPLFAWLAMTTIGASWMLLFFGKLWESRTGDNAHRRFWQMTAGLGMGLLSGVAFNALQVPVVYPYTDFNHTPFSDTMLYSGGGNPHPYTFALFFGGLFLLMRWWMHADPLRSSRLSLFSVIVTVLVAAAGCLLLPVPRGIWVAGAVATVTQISSVWVNTETRKRFKDKMLAA